jgi:hypothetical protein
VLQELGPYLGLTSKVCQVYAAVLVKNYGVFTGVSRRFAHHPLATRSLLAGHVPHCVCAYLIPLVDVAVSEQAGKSTVIRLISPRFANVCDHTVYLNCRQFVLSLCCH